MLFNCAILHPTCAIFPIAISQDHAYVVSMWDDRQFARPVFSIHRQLGIVLQLSWSPVKSGCLALLSQEAPYLRLIDLPCGTEDFHSELYSDDSFVNTLGFRHCYSGQPGNCVE